MMAFGERLRVTLFGSSHGPEVGATVDGVPKGTRIDPVRIQAELDRRRPVGRRLATRRREADHLVIDAGVERGRATGERIRMHVANEDVQRGPYDRLRDIPRPGHADYPARVRYGPTADLSGGGIFSGRMTVGLVAAGAIARELLDPTKIEALAYTVSIGGVDAPAVSDVPLREVRRRAAGNEVGCPDTTSAAGMEREIERARREGDSVGGVIECRAEGLPVGVGEPFFDSVESCLSHWLFSIPAVKGVEFGDGFRSARMRASAHNDAYQVESGTVRLRSNHAGGVLGGLTDGAPVVVRVAVKPTPSIAHPQDSVNLATGEPVRLVVGGRHDPCIVPRAVVVVESVVRLGLADLLLRGKFL